MIGLVDYDLQTAKSINLFPPNLEIMKLANYYKTEENKFCHLIDLDETDLTGYDKIYFFSESTKNPIIPSQFLRFPNIIYGGTTFTNGVYQPFENEIIDYILPRTFIYKEFLKNKYNEGIKANVINHILDDAYYRAYAGKNKLPLVPTLPNKRFYLYDKEFFYPDWEDLIQAIIDRKPSSIIRIHPIECKTLTQFFNLRNYTKINRDNAILLNLDIPLTDTNYMLKKYAKYFLADIVASTKVYLPLGGDWPSANHYYKDLIYKLNLLYSFWSYGIMIKIKYEAPSIGINNPVTHLSQLISIWSNTIPKQEKTLNERMYRRTIKKPSIYEEERNTLIKLFPHEKDLFNQKFSEIKKRGVWRI